MSLRDELDLRQPSAAGRARSSISLGAAFALFCAVLLGYDSPPSRAANGFIDALFGPGPVGGAPYYGGYAPRHWFSRDGARRVRRAKAHRAILAQARRHVTERRKFALVRRAAPVETRRDGGLELVAFSRNDAFKITSANGPSIGANRRAVCVRTCDGYHFPALPISRAANLAAQQASCEKLCPGAQSTLFVLPPGSENVAEAKAVKGGETYSALRARLDLGDARARSCSCQAEAGAGAVTRALYWDSTLRPGDTVVTAQGVRIVKRGSHYPFNASDFLSLAEAGDAPLPNKSALYAIERALKTPQGRLAVTDGDRHRAGGKGAKL